MAAYTDSTKMVAAFGESEIIQLTDRSGAGIIDVTVLSQAIANASAEADSYVGAAYELPLPTVPAVLSSFVSDIARYHLYSAQPTDAVKARYERAVSWLRDVSRGVVSLGFSATEEQPETTIVVVSTRPQVFSESLLAKMGPV